MFPQSKRKFTGKRTYSEGLSEQGINSQKPKKLKGTDDVVLIQDSDEENIKRGRTSCLNFNVIKNQAREGDRHDLTRPARALTVSNETCSNIVLNSQNVHSSSISSSVGTPRSSRASSPIPAGRTVITLTDDANEDDEDYIEFLRSDQIAQKRRVKFVPRILRSTRIEAVRVQYDNVSYSVNDCVEFVDRSFMKIQHIYRSKRNGYLLVGPIFVHICEIGPAMPNERDGLDWSASSWTAETNTQMPLYYKGEEVKNELIQKIWAPVSEVPSDHGLWLRKISDVRRHRMLIMTNKLYHLAQPLISGHTIHRELSKAPLICRWKETLVQNQYGKWSSQELSMLGTKDADEEHCSLPTKLALEWQNAERGHAQSLHTKGAGEKYTFADAFCGAGGVSSGAWSANLQLSFAFDKDSNKIETHRLNFRHTGCKSMVCDVSTFIARAKRHDWRVDVLHLSPPCQAFSPANTRRNEERDETNQTPLLACTQLINSLRPRVVTVEETPGLKGRHQTWFNALINQFTELGFSVAWKYLWCWEYSVPQTRKRLIVIAAAPGESLPPFPRPTHRLGDCSIRKTLIEIEKYQRGPPRRALTHHDNNIYSGRSTFALRPSYNSDRLAKTLTCSGGDNYHPSGLRQFTPRELACLQTFPFSFEFPEDQTVTESRAQIGNAVPPKVMDAIYKNVVASLRATDKERLGGRPYSIVEVD